MRTPSGQPSNGCRQKRQPPGCGSMSSSSIAFATKTPLSPPSRLAGPSAFVGAVWNGGLNGTIRLGNCHSIAGKGPKIHSEMETVNKTVTESSLRGPATEGSEAVQDRSGNRAVETTRKPVSPITGKGLPVILGRDGKPLRGVALLAKLGKHP